MSAVSPIAIRSLTRTSTHVKWLKPEPLWDSSEIEMNLPFVAEFTKDSFIPDFLAMLAGTLPLALDIPRDTQIRKGANNTTFEVSKLYQPLHQRFYLVTGSLVCRQFGLPDHTVVAKHGEKTSFVLRRSLAGLEYGWVKDGPDKGWQPLLDEQKRPVLVRKDEQRLPLHPVKTCATTLQGKAGQGVVSASRQTECYQRKVYYGYIPVDARETYLSAATNVAQDVQQSVDTGDLRDPRMDAVDSLVLEPWSALYIYTESKNGQKIPHLRDKNPPLQPFQKPSMEEQQVTSVKLIVDLGNFLKENMPGVFDAITTGTTLTAGSQRQLLAHELRQIFLDADHGSHNITLADAIKDLQDSARLADAESDAPAHTYNLYSALRNYPLAEYPAGTSFDPLNGNHQDAPIVSPPPATVYEVHVRDIRQQNVLVLYYLDPGDPGAAPVRQPGLLSQIMQAALNEEKAERVANNIPWLTVPPEIAGLLKNDPVDGDVYFLRLLYEYGEGCAVLSDPSRFFAFARPFDADAPARPVRIELPSVRLKDLRKFKRGVGMQTSCELHSLTNSLNLDALSSGGTSLQNCGVDIGMICAFSIQIITLVAFIVMFIFLIALNIVFWWLPFLRICFPILKPKQ